jgi:hypothetical protein
MLTVNPVHFDNVHIPFIKAGALTCFVRPHSLSSKLDSISCNLMIRFCITSLFVQNLVYLTYLLIFFFFHYFHLVLKSLTLVFNLFLKKVNPEKCKVVLSYFEYEIAL